MHKRTYQIIHNLGYEEKITNLLKKKEQLTRKTLHHLKKIGVPNLAIDQIKFFEGYPKKTEVPSNKDLIKSLLAKYKRTLNSFASKGIEATIIFENNKWSIYSNSYSKPLEKLHVLCKSYFDELSNNNLEVTIIFDGSNSWKILTKKESDLPDT